MFLYSLFHLFEPETQSPTALFYHFPLYTFQPYRHLWGQALRYVVISLRFLESLFFQLSEGHENGLLFPFLPNWGHMAFALSSC